jgi:hypothetical protein
MNIRIAAFLVFVASSAIAGDLYPTVDAYVKASSPDDPFLHLSTEKLPKNQSKVFGVAYGDFPSNRQAFVFVLDRVSDKGFREIAKSRSFDFSDPSARTDFEIIKAQSDTRFSIQVNSRTACGVYVTIYRFAFVGESWVVSGLDTTEQACGNNGIEISAERSTNFLTGKRITHAYRNGKLFSTTSKRIAIQKFPLTYFDSFDPEFTR